ncbi:MAG: phosphate ABC transporter permease subunit PstC [Deltaproteobacteria bacterium]|jgi:phosphate transport system permease protein|nr:phosphate ABC transporter permease subunit PstC [Deltaproteobacteria bacterium]
MKAAGLKNNIFKIVCAVSSVSILLIVAGMLVTLLVESLPAFREFGFFNFLTSSEWNYSQDIYGARRPIFGTLLTTALALIVSFPVAIGTAIFLTELCPEKLKGSIGTALELLSAIPSIIYGMWGLFVLAPFLEESVQPLIKKTLGNLPLIGSFFVGPLTGGVSLFTTSMILAVMILPFMTSISREAFNQVPPILKESSYALGATRWETMSKVVMPFTRLAVTGGATIAMGRALGETMAVAYVIGNRHAALDSIFSPYVTVTSVMANEFNEASGIKLSVLFALALILFMANFLVLSLSKKLLGSRS